MIKLVPKLVILTNGEKIISMLGELTDDNGESCLYHISCFTPLDRWRENQIDIALS